MPIHSLFPLPVEYVADYPTQAVIEHFTQDEITKNHFKQSIQHIWSNLEGAVSLRKLFLSKTLEYLEGNSSPHASVIKAILTDWAQHATYHVVEWSKIYRALEANTPLPQHCNHLTQIIYTALTKKNWRVRVEGAQSSAEGEQMLRDGTLLTFLIWLEYPEYRPNFQFHEMSIRIILHIYAYAVRWEEVVKSLG